MNDFLRKELFLFKKIIIIIFYIYIALYSLFRAFLAIMCFTSILQTPYVWPLYGKTVRVVTAGN